MAKWLDKQVDRVFDWLMVRHWSISVGVAIVVYLFIRFLPHYLNWSPGFVTGAVYTASLMAPIAAFPYMASALLTVLGSPRAKARLENLHHLVELRSLDWQAFQECVADIYTSKGYATIVSPEGADGGIDIVIRNKDEVAIVQCKSRMNDKVDRPMVQQLHGALVEHGEATRAIFATNGRYTSDAKELAKKHPKEIELLDLDDLVKLLSEVREKPLEGYVAPDPEERIPECPKCGALMNWIPAERNPSVGRGFYACSTFAKSGCKGKFDPKCFVLAQRA